MKYTGEARKNDFPVRLLFHEGNTMNKIICDVISFPGDEKVKSDDLAIRIVAAGESVQSQLMYVSNVQELLTRLTAEGYRLE